MRTVGWTTFAVRTVATVALLAGAATVHARMTPDQKCEKGRYDAAAKYTACQHKAAAKLYGGAGFSKHLDALAKCVGTYAATWPKLQKKARDTDATCDAERFLDNGTTVTDNLTGLQWEKKIDGVGVHDRDGLYSWSTSADGDPTDADGTVFTAFLATLNGGSCFAGHCDWRMPTLAELQTILLEPYPCETMPCVASVFGPTRSNYYWTASMLILIEPDRAWLVGFDRGSAARTSRTNTEYVRAVRGGL